MITFAVVAHNEAQSVGAVVGQALAACRRGDRVVVVDSASTDDTAGRAAQAGAEVLAAPLGKGAAMRHVAARTATPWLCYLDADLVEADRDIPALLRAAVDDALVMVVGEFADPPPEPVLSNTIALYPALVRALFPEADGRFGRRPLSGFRAIRPELAEGLPDDFGAEAYLNLTVALSGRPHLVTDIGLYAQRFRYKGDMGRQIGRTILDVATAHGRLDPAMRPEWDDWVDRLVEAMAAYRGEPEDRDRFRAHLLGLAAAPLPPTGMELTR
jgi:glucosyl-3-phosphoglycerate synthase